MGEYIERKRVYAAVSRLLNQRSAADFTKYEEGFDNAVCEIMSIIKEFPAANVRPEKHGEWKETSYDRQVIYCSSCGERSPCDWDWDFCPRCGAKMDEIE